MPVLMYHDVAQTPVVRAFRRFVVPPALFGEHLVALSEAGYKTGRISQLCHGSIAQQTAFVTFDDGFGTIAEHALPALAEREMTATLFLPSAFIGRRACWLAPLGEDRRRLLDWAEVRDAATSGFEIGSHGHRHLELDTLNERQLEQELVVSKGVLEDETSTAVQSLAYPFGYHNRRVRSAVARAGYQAACEVGYGLHGEGPGSAAHPSSPDRTRHGRRTSSEAHDRRSADSRAAGASVFPVDVETGAADAHRASRLSTSEDVEFEVTAMNDVRHPALTASATVVICAYSEARWGELCAAISSVERQTHPADECLLVIDHNPDLFKRSVEVFPNVKVIENVQATGLAGARNTGVGQASGEVIVFLDDDAWAEPDCLNELLRPYADPSVIGTGGLVVPAWIATPPAWFPKEFYWVIGCSYRGLPETAAPIRNPIGAAMSFRRSVFEEVGLFSANVGRITTVPLGCEETELAIRALRHFEGSKIVHVPSAVVHHSVGPERLDGWLLCATLLRRRDIKIYRRPESGLARGSLSRAHLHPQDPAVERQRRAGPPVLREPHTVSASLMALLGLATTSLGYGVGQTGFAERATKMLSWGQSGDRSQTFVEAGGRRKDSDGETGDRVEEASPAARLADANGTPELHPAAGHAVSVVICSHQLDRWDWLREAVQSVARQTLPAEETWWS